MNSSSTISVTGADAFEFLQGQLTNNLKRLPQQQEILAAWCSPKGRVICLFNISAIDDGYELSLAAELTEEIIKRLTMFRFRSKVEFASNTETTTVDAAASIKAGIPWIGQDQTEKFTPHMLNLDLLDAVDFEKGCYTGQEIVARTHYKGATKRRVQRFESDSPVNVGDKISLDDRDIGEVLNASGNNLLAVVPVEKAGEHLSVEDAKLTLMPLPYFDVAVS